MGKILWHLPEEQNHPATKFLGYRLNDNGIPTMMYERQGAHFEETIETAGKRDLRAEVAWLNAEGEERRHRTQDGKIVSTVETVST